MSEMKRAIAREERIRAVEEQKRVTDRFASTLVIAASIIAAIRLARDEIGRSSPRLTTVIADSVGLARQILEKIVRLLANLLLSRAAMRRREIAVRTALGAGRTRVIRQLLTESVLLGLMGGAAGIAIAALSLLVARRMHPGNIPRLDELTLDFRVLAFTFLISIATGIIFGLAPALRASHVDLTSSLKAGARGALSGGLSIRHDKLRGALVIAELAISLPLLVGAGLLERCRVWTKVQGSHYARAVL
jgi:hypothetical protein